MPLHAENPVLVRLVLTSLDHAIGCNRGNAQAMPKVSNRLVMRGVYPYVKSVAALIDSGGELAQLAASSGTEKRGNAKGQARQGEARPCYVECSCVTRSRCPGR